MFWIGSYLTKDEDGEVTGLCTAVKADNISAAVLEIEKFIREKHWEEYMITDVGIGEEESAQHVGHEWIDPMADETWPEGK